MDDVQPLKLGRGQDGVKRLGVAGRGRKIAVHGGVQNDAAARRSKGVRDAKGGNAGNSEHIGS